MNLISLESARWVSLKPFSLQMTTINDKIATSQPNSHQKFFHGRFVESVPVTQSDGRKRDVAIQIVAVDGNDCWIVQVTSPEERRVVARQDHERDHGETPKYAEKVARMKLN